MAPKEKDPKEKEVKVKTPTYFTKMMKITLSMVDLF